VNDGSRFSKLRTQKFELLAPAVALFLPVSPVSLEQGSAIAAEALANNAN
jgi:hypothetical protein